MDYIKLNGTCWNLVPIRNIKSKEKFAKHPKYSQLNETDRDILWYEAHPEKKETLIKNEKNETE